jgi:TonB family protein
MRVGVLTPSIVCCLALGACHRTGTSPLQSNVPGTTPLMTAAAKGNIASVSRLLRGGASVNQADRDGYTALHRASHCGDIRVIKELIAAGADVNARTKENVTPLLISIDMGCPKPEVTMTLIEAGADVNVAESGGDTAIVIAATETSFDVMRELLKRGANPNAQGQGGETALHYAAMNDLLDRVELLLESGARIDIRNSAGKTALEVASPNAKKLLERVLVPRVKGLGTSPTINGPFQLAPTESYSGPPVIKFLVQEDGTVSDVRLIRSSGVADIDKKLLKAYSGWKYRAQAGRPVVESEVSVIIDWR